MKSIRDWFSSLERAPEALTGRQWGALAAASLVAALSRLFALARTPWDWDELLFMLSLDRFDVARHRPHPPGFPLFVLSAKLVRKLGFGDFHALQAVDLVAAIAIVPAMFFLCRELRMRAPAALSAAMLLAFFPNVWFYGGGAFSDVPSMTLIVTALALLFAGCRNGRLYLLGSLMLAISAGFRPQNLVVGFVPFLIVSWFQRKKVEESGPPLSAEGIEVEDSGPPLSGQPRAAVLHWERIALSIVMITIVVGGSYGIAAWLTGWSEYRMALRIHRAYIVSTDSFLSPVRPPLWRVFDDFFVMPYHAPVISAIAGVLALIAILRRRPPVLAALAAFGPLCILSWLMLDRFSASRFSIGYAPLIAILAADGLSGVAQALLPVRSGRSAGATWFEGIASAAIVVFMAVWTWPAIAATRHSIAPPIAAVDWIRNHVDARTSMIYVDTGMVPFAEWYLPEYRLHFIGELEPPPSWAHGQPGYYLREDASSSPHAENFIRPHGRLWDLVRQRYFDVSVRPIEDLVTFVDGWYLEEGSGAEVWRWMGAHSVALLPPIAGDARLTLSFYIPLDALKQPPHVVVRVNGAVADQFVGARTRIEREVIVHARRDAPNVLTIDTDRVVNPAGSHIGSDARTLGLRLNSIGWMQAR